MSSAELLRLAERVEGLTGPDREIDGLIACAIFKTISTDDDLIYRVPICKADECAAGTYWHVQRSGRSLQTAPAYTSSLDAAESLVPEGNEWVLARTHDPHDGDKQYFYASIAESQVHYAGSPALALTVAALRAMARAPARREGEE